MAEKRIIKFRGMPWKTGGWIYGGYWKGNSAATAFIAEDSDEPPFRHVPVMPETVGQFTGLFDATKWDDLSGDEKIDWCSKGGTADSWKGREIYEDDILSAQYHWGGPPSKLSKVEPKFVVAHCLVEWHETEWFLKSLNWKEAGVYEQKYGHWYRSGPDLARAEENDLRVIGNRFENPELLAEV